MLTGLAVQTTEEKDRELDRLLLRVGQGDREAFARLYSLTRGRCTPWRCPYSGTPMRPRMWPRTSL